MQATSHANSLILRGKLKKKKKTEIEPFTHQFRCMGNNLADFSETVTYNSLALVSEPALAAKGV